MHRARFILALVTSATACTDVPSSPGAGGASARPPARARLAGPYSTWVSVIDLGTFGRNLLDQNDSYASAINDDGVVVGHSTRPGTDHVPFIWTEATGMVWNGVPSGVAYDIARAGMYTGRMRIPGDPMFRQAAYRSLGDPLAPTGFDVCCEAGTQGYGINDHGVIVGSMEGARAFVWNPATRTLTSLHPAGVTTSTAVDINDANVIAGTDFTSTTARAWRMPLGGARSYLTVPSGEPTSASDINNAGVVVGHRRPGPGQTRAVLWDAAGVATDLDASGEQSAAYGVNQAGYAVGHAGTLADKNAVLWKPDGEGRVNLPELGPGFSAALDVNRRLDVVGSSTVGGEAHAVLWQVRFVYTVAAGVRPSVDLGDQIHLNVDVALRATLYSSNDVDATSIDPAVLTLGDGAPGAPGAPPASGKEGKPLAEYQDVDGDGLLDLVVYFHQAALEQRGDLTAKTTELVLRGDLGDGRVVEGRARVEVK